MLNFWRTDWWGMVPAVLLIAVLAIFSSPQVSSSQVESGADFHATDDMHHENEPVSDHQHEAPGHCHAGLDCSVQAVSVSGYNAGFIVADLRLSFRSVDDTLVSRPVSFDPPPPRVQS